MSRPRWIQPRRRSTSRRLVPPGDTPPARPLDSSTRSSVPARRANATSRSSRSRERGRRPEGPARSTTRTSTARAWSSAPASARPSSAVSGASTSSHSSMTPRATASTGSRLRSRSSQATIDPAAWASATSRSATVVRPLEGSPPSVRLAVRGTPPGPNSASSSGNPVEMTGMVGASSPVPSGRGTVASAPIVAPNASSPRRGAA
jgi:hypothetical protein